MRHVATGCRPSFQSELGHWLDDSSRFGTFINANRDKVRKKLGSAGGEEGRLDVRAELLVAYLLLADRRFELAFEAYGAQRIGPDLTVTYRANQRFNLEVTRVRARAESARTDETSTAGSPDAEVARVANVMAGKLRQLTADLPNALVITGRGLALNQDSLAAAARLLKTHNDRNHDEFFVRRGFTNARDFYARYLRLGGTFVLDEDVPSRFAVFAANREARQPLPAEVALRLAALLGNHGVAHGG